MPWASLWREFFKCAVVIAYSMERQFTARNKNKIFEDKTTIFSRLVHSKTVQWCYVVFIKQGDVDLGRDVALNIGGGSEPLGKVREKVRQRKIMTDNINIIYDDDH